MKIIIFAGGSGRRLWPISRQKSPKQFEPIIGSQSTLQLAVGRVEGTYGAENIFVSTNERYLDIIAKQLPQLPPQNLIGEPTRRDLAAAVGLAMIHLAASDTEKLQEEPVAILWGDNYMDNVAEFLGVMETAAFLLQQDEAKIIFVGETPRFANDNLGWIGLGDKLGAAAERPYYRFNSLTYRPPREVCQQMFAEQSHVWNTGYFVTTINFVLQLYREQQPEMWAQLTTIAQTIGTDEYAATLAEVYPQMAAMSFDDAILTHIAPEQAVVVHGEMGWSDPGTLYALKEAVNPDPAANVTKGGVIDTDSKDCLIYNYEEGKLVAAVGLEGMIVVNTEDAILVVPKDRIPLVKEVVNSLEGTEWEAYS
ncbi:MAG: sugar phosphate nucleotidyltransferase [Chloroflexota bacterium]